MSKTNVLASFGFTIGYIRQTAVLDDKQLRYAWQRLKPAICRHYLRYIATMILARFPSLSRSFGYSASGTTVLLAIALAGHAQAPIPRPLAGTYRYTAYTVFDAESPNEPTAVQGVGGTLLLHPNGTYAKRLTITLGPRTVPFNQDGTYTLAGDSIRFAFRDQKGADVQRGTARLDSTGRRLTLTILGYPAGNKGVYELEAAPAAPAVPPAPKAAVAPPAKTGKKRRR